MYEHVKEIILIVEISNDKEKICIISVSAPNSNKSNEETNIFYKILESEIPQILNSTSG